MTQEQRRKNGRKEICEVKFCIWASQKAKKSQKQKPQLKSLRANAGPKSGKTETFRENQGEMDKES